ncbi:carbohydrate ABC transporter permease [Paenibacillus hamazuiensis]|uniref:carbohydrate ABC transporter permease n=1 Tax=Paenibacillus hamazuiensis TaxID=2936508 RepID=UPI00201036A2|nr:carbohydrate ABC transporter permease [Paenibacillus hamazuiensis]
MTQTTAKRWIVQGLVIAFACIFMLPFIIMLVTSLKSMAEIQSPAFQLLPRSFLFSNYAEAMSQGNWPRYFLNSVTVTTITVGIGIIIMSVAGFAFARLNFAGRDLLFLLSLVGLMIPEQVIMIPVFMKIKGIPFAGGNDVWGDGGTGWLNTYWGLIVPHLAHPFGMFLFRQFFLGFPKELDEAAKVDGCSRLRSFFSMYIPLSLPIFATVALLKTINNWNQYTWPLIITNSDEMKTVQLALSMFKSEAGLQWNYIMASTTLIALPMLLLFIFLQKYYVQGIVTSGVKG